VASGERVEPVDVAHAPAHLQLEQVVEDQRAEIDSGS
jgi:hypothetical protein